MEKKEVPTNMAKVKSGTSKLNTSTKRRPAITPEAREQQLISLAVDLVEQRLIDGTASSQETTHFLKLATSKYRLETEKLRTDNELNAAKTQAIKSAENQEQLYKEAIAAMRRYSGQGDPYDEY